MNKVAIVTGGASGIGLATAKELLKNNVSVVLADISDNVTEIASSLQDDKVVGIKIDVSNEESVKNLMKQTIAKFGRIDYLVSNAGIGGTASLPHEVTTEEWNKVVAVNQTGIYLTNKYAILEMLKTGGGAIVNTTSMYGIVGTPTSYAYSATKGAIIQMTKSSALAYAKQNIRVNAVAPGYVDTAILAAVPQEVKDMMAGTLPIGRLGTAEEIAHSICFLLSEKSSFTTGTILSIDGGFVAQ